MPEGCSTIQQKVSISYLFYVLLIDNDVLTLICLLTLYKGVLFF